MDTISKVFNWIIGILGYVFTFKLTERLRDCEESKLKLRNENSELQKQIVELQELLLWKGAREYCDGLLYIKGGNHEDIAYCPACEADQNKLIPLTLRKSNVGSHFCPQCRNTFGIPPAKTPVQIPNIKWF
jgi:hypothetical protein